MSLADEIRKKKAESQRADTLQQAMKGAMESQAKEAEKKAADLTKRFQAKTEKAVAKIEAGGEALAAELAAVLQPKVDAAKTRYQDLVKRVQMVDIVRETSSLGGQIENFPEAIAKVRERGYKFRSYLDKKMEVMAEQWDDINTKVQSWLETESASLDDELADAEAYFSRFAGELTSRSESLLGKFTAILDNLQTQVEASEAKIRALYDSLSREVSTTTSQLYQVGTHLDWLEASGIRLNQGEGLYIAAEAEWDDGKDKPDGYLYVTDQRLIFEQAEKKGGMMGFGGKQVREQKWEVSFDKVEKVQNEDKGLFGGKDFMILKLGSGAPYSEIRCEIKGGIDSKTWAQQVNRAVQGLIAQESNVTPDPELMERLKNAPTDCPNCGGVLPKLLSGQTEASCKYCGSVMRI
jgi:hypothetical protein